MRALKVARGHVVETRITENHRERIGRRNVLTASADDDGEFSFQSYCELMPPDNVNVGVRSGHRRPAPW